MRRLFLVFAALVACSAPSFAQVIRCVDAAGAVSYTDDKSCPAGARASRQLLGAEATPPKGAQEESAGGNVAPPPAPMRQAIPRPLPGPAQSALQQQQAPGGLTIIDPRGNAPSTTSRWSDRSASPGGDVVVDDGSYGYPYPVYPGVYPRGARPLQDMRPQLRGCGPSGCQDTLGNSYDRSGKLTQFQRPDGRTCQQVGTTQVCR